MLYFYLRDGVEFIVRNSLLFMVVWDIFVYYNWVCSKYLYVRFDNIKCGLKMLLNW